MALTEATTFWRELVRFAFGCALITAAGACGSHDSLVLPEVEWEGSYIRFGASERAGEYCEGSLRYQDGYAGGLYGVLGVDPGAETIRFSFLGPGEVPGSDGGTFARSTTDGILSASPVLEHELVHAVRRTNGLSHEVVAEGLAEYFGGDGDFSFRRDTSGSLEAALVSADEKGGLAGEHYGVAGRFVAHIDQMYGRDTLLDLARRLRLGDSQADFESALAVATGDPSASVVAEFASVPVCPQVSFRDPTPACLGAEPLDWCEDAAPRTHSIDLTCGAADVVGFRDEEMWAYRKLVVPRQGAYGVLVIQNAEAGGAYIEIKECRGGCDSFYFRRIVPSGPAPADWFDLEPGEYIVKIAAPRSAEQVVTLQFLGAECTE